jgi:SulP family sulfate permease
MGVEAGVVIGVVLSMGTLIWRASRPHIAVLGRIAGTEHFRNIERYPAQTTPGVLIMRVDSNLFFGNVEAVNERLEEELAGRPDVKELVLVLSSVSSIDTSALFALAEWNDGFRRRDIRLHLAEVKGPVMDRLRQSELPGRLSGQIFLSTAIASDELVAGLTQPGSAAG